MRKIIFVFIMGVLISIFVSCFSTEHYLIVDFDLYGLEARNSTPNENSDFKIVTDTIRKKPFFRIKGISEYQYGYINNLNLIDRCYATTVPEKLDNEIIVDSLELRLNSDIYFESDTIKSGTDLWNNPKIKEYKWFKIDSDRSSFNATIGFTDSFYEKVRIPAKVYSIEITCKTSDNKKITKSIELFIK